MSYALMSLAAVGGLAGMVASAQARNMMDFLAFLAINIASGLVVGRALGVW